MAADATHVVIARDGDIVEARRKGRELAQRIGFTGSDLTVIATAISEIAPVVYADRGKISLSEADNGGRRGIVVVARDEGQGIPDIERAMCDGYSTGNSLGLGLPGARRLMDDFEIMSTVGQGTTVTMRKWKR